MAKHQCGTCWNEWDCGKECVHKGFYVLCAPCKRGIHEGKPTKLF